MLKNSNWFPILVVAGTVLLVAGLAATGKAPTKTNGGPTAAAALTTDHATYDFGEISMAAGSVSHPFAIRLTGEEPVTLHHIETSCMCTTATLTIGGERLGPFGMPGHGGPSGVVDQTLATGETATVDVIYDPAAHGPSGVGPFNRQIMVETAVGATLVLTISGTVTP